MTARAGLAIERLRRAMTSPGGGGAAGSRDRAPAARAWSVTPRALAWAVALAVLAMMAFVGLIDLSALAGVAFIGDIFGGGGSSSSSSTTTSTTDKRQVVSDYGVGVSSDQSTVNVTLSDHNAIQSALDLTKTGTEHVAGALDKVLGFAGQVLKLQEVNAGLVGKTQESVSDAYSTANDFSGGSKLIALGALAVAALFGWAMLRKGKGG